MLRMLIGALLATAALVAGCGGSSETGETTARDPGREVVGALVDAAEAGDVETMWALLSEPSRRRAGPTLAAFRRGTAKELIRALAPFAGGELPVQVSENVDGAFGIVALSRGDDAWAVPLRREGSVWRIELPGPLDISVTGPPPRSQGKFVNQIGVEVTGRSGPGTALLYLDGVTLDSRVYSSRTSATVYANFAGGLEPGRHTAVAFATSGDRAAARAWTFRP